MASETMIHEGQAARDWAAQAEPQISVTNGGVQGRSDFAATLPLLKSALSLKTASWPPSCTIALNIRHLLLWCRGMSSKLRTIL